MMKHAMLVLIEYSIAIAVVVLLACVPNMLTNCNARQRCKSLQAQGVDAYLASGFFEDECVVPARGR